jgi:hypothetical protein
VPARSRRAGFAPLIEALPRRGPIPRGTRKNRPPSRLRVWSATNRVRSSRIAVRGRRGAARTPRITDRKRRGEARTLRAADRKRWGAPRTRTDPGSHPQAAPRTPRIRDRKRRGEARTPRTAVRKLQVAARTPRTAVRRIDVAPDPRWIAVRALLAGSRPSLMAIRALREASRALPIAIRRSRQRGRHRVQVPSDQVHRARRSSTAIASGRKAGASVLGLGTAVQRGPGAPSREWGPRWRFSERRRREARTRRRGPLPGTRRPDAPSRSGRS